MGTDINDAALKGVGLRELAAAADRQPPALSLEWEPVAEDGLNRLAKLKKEVLSAQDWKAAIELLTTFQGDQVAMHAAAMAWFHKTDLAEALLNAMDAVDRGATRTLRDFKKAVQKRGDRLGNKKEKVKATPLDFLTKDLGVTGLVVPEHYTIDTSGVKFDDEVVLSTPAIISHVAHSRSGWFDEVAFKVYGKWVRKVVKRSQLADSKSIIASLADWGLPVTSANGVSVMNYFRQFSDANRTTLTPVAATHGFGWTPDLKSFLIGEECLGEPALCLVPPHEKTGFATSGTWDGYKAAVKRHVAHHPKILCGILAACAAPLLAPLEAPGFTFAYAGETSSGKGTAQHVIAAAYGHPYDTFKSWASATTVGLYNNLAAAGDLPVIFEDTKDAKDPEYVGRMLYAVVDGKEPSKGREHGGNREPLSWRTVLITSGETSVTTLGQKSGGGAARALEFRGQTYNGTAGDIGPMLDDFRKHHGHLIRKVILSSMGRAEELKDLRRKALLKLSPGSTGGVESRMNENVATLMVAAQVCEDVGLGIDFTEALGELRVATKQSAAAADRTGEACDRLMARAIAFRNAFHDGTGKAQPPVGGWLGYWKDDYGYDHIGFRPDVFDKWTKEDGFNPNDITTSLAQRGMLVREGGRHPRCIDMGGARLITILRHAFKENS